MIRRCIFPSNFNLKRRTKIDFSLTILLIVSPLWEVRNLDEENTNPIQIEVEKNISPIKVGEKVFVKFETNCIFDFC